MLKQKHSGSGLKAGKRKRHTGFKLAGCLVRLSIALVLLVASGFVMNLSLGHLVEMRKLERLNLTALNAMTEGLYRVRGQVVASVSLVDTPYSRESALYVRYRHQQESRDSDGQTKTTTLDSGVRLVPDFFLEDATGRIRVVTDRGAHWEPVRSFQRRSGRNIYTEWAIFPGQTVELSGLFQGSDFVLRYTGQSLAPRVVSGQDMMADVAGLGVLLAALGLSGAVLLLALGLVLLFGALGVARYWTYTTSLSLSVVVLMVWIGHGQLVREWHQVADIVEIRSQAAGVSEASRQDMARFYWRMRQLAANPIDYFYFNRLIEPLFDADVRQLAERLPNTPLEDRVRFTPHVWGSLSAVFTLLLALLLLRKGAREIRTKRRIEGLPFSHAGLSYGLAKVKGRILPAVAPLSAPALADMGFETGTMAAFRYLLKERRGSGKKVHWATLVDQCSEQDFRVELEDGGGRVQVRQAGAQVDYQHLQVIREGAREHALFWFEPGDPVVAVGQAGVDEASPDRLVLMNSPDFRLLLSAGTEKQLLQGMARWAFSDTALSLSFFMLTLTLLFAFSGAFTPDNLVYTLLAIPLFMLCMVCTLHYNDLVQLRNTAFKARENIQVQLKKRAELWPAIERVVQQYAAHERGLLADLAEARQADTAWSQAAGLRQHLAQEHQLVDRVMGLAEAYPALAAEALVAQFQQIMTETEQELVHLRDYCAAAIEKYNTRIQSFPDLVLARVCGFRGLSWDVLPS